jgi:hypothetical protein
MRGLLSLCATSLSTSISRVVSLIASWPDADGGHPAVATVDGIYQTQRPSVPFLCRQTRDLDTAVGAFREGPRPAARRLANAKRRDPRKNRRGHGADGLVDPETYRDLFGKLIAPTGERLYSGRPPRYVTGTGMDKDEEVAAAVAALDEFVTPAEVRRTRAKVLGSTGAAVPFYDLTFSATKSVSLLQASYAANAAKARERGDSQTADEYEARVKAIDDAAVETARQVKEGRAASHLKRDADQPAPLPRFLLTSRL